MNTSATTFTTTLARIALCSLAACTLPWGCSGAKSAAPAQIPVKPAAAPVAPAPALPADDELARAGVNEVGQVPVLEYHEIDNGHTYMFRSPARFRHDLERLYEQGFRPITMREYLDNHIDLPLGRSPVILTFDDARNSQLQFLPDGKIDPNCAVGILQAFHADHPDFALKATFFVLPVHPFGSYQAEAQRKLHTLVDIGFELQNHTLNHHYFNRMTDAAIRREIALGQAGILKLMPDVHIDVLALPGGYMPRSHNHQLLLTGDSDGIHYANRAVFLAAAGPAPAPAAKKFIAWRLPRILAVEGDAGVTYWLDDFKRHPHRRYVSDGNPNTLSIPASASTLVDKGKLQGAELHIYGGTEKVARVAGAKGRQRKQPSAVQ
jgi:peptidoglycan/xylan/chitin deacetylase (PgdA/CDA1 family)